LTLGKRKKSKTGITGEEFKEVPSMAWTDQCKIEFRTTAGSMIDKGKGVRETLRDISKDSGVPYNTLRRWYYPKEESVTKTGNTKRKPSQEAAWKNAARRMESLVKYMNENCDAGAEVSEETRKAAGYYGEEIGIWSDRLHYRSMGMEVHNRKWNHG
jgi:hypothetical protein